LLSGLTAVCMISISSRTLESACVEATMHVDASIINIKTEATMGEALAMFCSLVGRS
jgi:hypothetical protein